MTSSPVSLLRVNLTLSCKVFFDFLPRDFFSCFLTTLKESGEEDEAEEDVKSFLMAATSLDSTIFSSVAFEVDSVGIFEDLNSLGLFFSFIRRFVFKCCAGCF